MKRIVCDSSNKNYTITFKLDVTYPKNQLKTMDELNILEDELNNAIQSVLSKYTFINDSNLYISNWVEN